VDFAHTTAAERARQDKAKQLARWCYARGVDVRVLELDPVVLRSIARQAGAKPPHQTGAASETSSSRTFSPPAPTGTAPAQCVLCAVGTSCDRHRPPTQ
jgi:hypothetical protein